MKKFKTILFFLCIMLGLSFSNKAYAGHLKNLDADAVCEATRTFTNLYYTKQLTIDKDYIVQDGFVYAYYQEEDCYVLLAKEHPENPDDSYLDEQKTPSYRNIYIPAYINGKPVCIVSDTFMCELYYEYHYMDESVYSSLSVVFPDTIEQCFAPMGSFTKMKAFYMPDSLEGKCINFGYEANEGLDPTDALRNYSNLQYVRFSENIKTIRGNTFDGCFLLDTINLPEGLKTIESYAFKGIAQNAKIYIPSSVTKIGKNICNDTVTIYCVKNSTAHKYAKENKIPYKLVKDTSYPVESVAFTEKEAAVEQGSTYVVLAKASPFYAENPDLTYKSDDASIATVDDYGVVSGIKTGTTTITAISKDNNQITARITVRVCEQGTLSALEGKTPSKLLQATASDGKNTYYAQKNVLYSISNKAGTIKKRATVSKSKDIQDISYYKDYVYFSSKVGGCWYIYRMKPNGKSLKQLAQGICPVIYDGKIYYISQKMVKENKKQVISTLGIGTMTLKGKEKQLLIEDTYADGLSVYKGTIYFRTTNGFNNYVDAYNMNGKPLDYGGFGDGDVTMLKTFGKQTTGVNVITKNKWEHCWRNSAGSGDYTRPIKRYMQTEGVLGVVDGCLYYCIDTNSAGKIVSSTLYKATFKKKGGTKTTSLKTIKNASFDTMLTGTSNWLVFAVRDGYSKNKINVVKIRTNGKDYSVKK